MKVVLYLNGGEGLLTLKTALRYADIACIVLPEGRENQEILSIADRNAIDVLYRGAKEGARLNDVDDSVLLSSAFPFKIKEEECASVKLAVNFHAAVLPKYRGLHGSAWALINDEPELGVTVHEIDNGFDSGAIVAMKCFGVEDSDELSDIQNKSKVAHETLLIEFMTNDYQSAANIPKENIYWRARTPDDSRINWHLEARKLFVFVRALNRPATCAWALYNSHRFEIQKVVITDERSDKLPGSVVLRHQKIFVCSGDGLLLEVVSYSSDSQLEDGMVLH